MSTRPPVGDPASPAARAVEAAVRVDVRDVRLERMAAEHVAAVCEIHRQSWSAHEVSVRLGGAFRRIFYASLVASPHAHGHVCLAGGQVVGYATGFSDYSRFNTALARRHLLSLAGIAAARILTGRLSPGDVRDLLTDGRKLRRLRYPRHHCGVMALASACKGTRLGSMAVRALADGVFEEAKARGAGGVWGACDQRNVGMQKVLRKLGFVRVDAVPFSRGVVEVWEKEFGAGASGAAAAPGAA